MLVAMHVCDFRLSYPLISCLYKADSGKALHAREGCTQI